MKCLREDGGVRKVNWSPSPAVFAAAEHHSAMCDGILQGGGEQTHPGVSRIDSQIVPRPSSTLPHPSTIPPLWHPTDPPAPHSSSPRGPRQ